jgi:site-specific DNA recombinase
MARRATKAAPQLAATPAAIYVRVSTEEQAADGYGLDVQRERCRAMATVKGWAVVREYADEGVSGTLGADERPGLAALLADVEADLVRAVVVLSLDRLGRKTRLVLDLVERLADAGAELVSCKESLDTTTPAGRFVLTLFAALAQLERDTIVERTTAGRDARGKRDGERGGRVPYGYRRVFDPKTGASVGVEVVEDQAAVVRRVIRARKRGQSWRAIAEKLNQDQVPAPRGATAWRHSSVQSIVENEALYRGGRRGESQERWPAIL